MKCLSYAGSYTFCMYISISYSVSPLFFWGGGSGEGAFSFYFVICRNMQSRVFNDQCLVTLSSWEDIKKMDRFCCVIL
jgi:hypothetical protein